MGPACPGAVALILAQDVVGVVSPAQPGWAGGLLPRVGF